MAKFRNDGGVESGAVSTSYTDQDGAYMDYDSAGGYVQFGAKRSGGGSLGLKLRTILAGVATTVLTFTSAGAATFIGQVTMGALAATTGTFSGLLTATGGINLAAAQSIVWPTRGSLSFPADGVAVLYDAAATSFGRLALGGTTDAFPSIKRVGATVHFRWAADGGDADVLAGNFQARSGSQFRAYSSTNADYVSLVYDAASNQGRLNKALIVAGAAGSCVATEVCYGGTTQTTVGAAGGASALPATPTGYVIINVAGTDRVFPFYAKV